MKHTHLYVIIFLLAGIGLCSCKKYEVAQYYPVSVSFQNVMNDNTSFYTYFTQGEPAVYNRLRKMAPGDFISYPTEDTRQFINFIDVNDTVSKSGVIVQKSLELEPGEIYSYFLYGSKEEPKEKLVQEAIPPYSLQDSVTHFRLVNLFENRSIDVHLTAPENKVLVTNLEYEGLTEFIKLDCEATTPGFSFEFKDHSTGELLASSTIVNDYGGSSPSIELLFRSNSITLFGKYSGPSDFTAGVGQLSHYRR